jgi:hypothetical protein
LVLKQERRKKDGKGIKMEEGKRRGRRDAKGCE